MNTVFILAGAPSARWSDWFETHVTKSSPDGLPLEGSLGVHWGVKEDLGKLYETFKGNIDKLEKHLQATVILDECPGFPDTGGGFISENQTQQLTSFFLWALKDEQPLFILRRGFQIVGLYRKTSSYYFDFGNPKKYDDRTHQRDRLPHRITYRFERPLTVSEQSKISLSCKPKTVLSINLNLTVPPGCKAHIFKGVKYLVHEETGHAYYRDPDGKRGKWAGILQKNPKPHIDESVPEPKDD